MDVVKLVVIISSFSFLISCAQEGQKTASNVIAEKATPKGCQTETVENQYIVNWEDGHVTVERGENEESFKDGFVTTNLEKIKVIHRDQRLKFYSQQELTMSEPLTPNSTSEADQTWGQTMIQASAVWEKNAVGKDVLVGVVDSYVDVTHSQLKNQILINKNEIPDNGKDDDGNGYVDDYSSMNFTNVSKYTIENEHGTHVTGIIASDHSGTMKGVAPGAKIIAAPFITNDGSGSLGDAINAMNYVVAKGARVINASWGGSVCVATLKNAFDDIAAKGVLIVVAAGNENRDLDTSPTYPAAFNVATQITVGASNMNDLMTSFSNSSFNLVHLAAPGDSIMSTTPGEKYNYLKGTSMAAPFVTGAAAVLMGAFPKATAAQIKDALIKSVDVTPNHEFRVVSRGRLNLLKAYNYLNR